MSGSATNSGIDYQQRVSAWFLIALLQGFDISEFIDLPDSLKVCEVAFETNKPIDDLQVKFHDGNTAYLQIKRSLTLSDQSQSDFYKTVEQFVSEYSAKPNSHNKYIIATSSDTSSKIKKDLRKILESMRLNDRSFSQNPFNNSEFHKISYNSKSFLISSFVGRSSILPFVSLQSSLKGSMIFLSGRFI